MVEHGDFGLGHFDQKSAANMVILDLVVLTKKVSSSILQALIE
jgi:hypothetical protein